MNIRYIRYVSDLHLDRQAKPFSETFKDKFPETDLDSETVLVIAGDIDEQKYWRNANEFFDLYANRFHSVINVLGNHDYWGRNIDNRLLQTKSVVASYGNVYILENESITIDGVVFSGCTLWTDMMNGDPLVMFDAKSIMNDFKYIRTHSYVRRFSPEYWVNLNALSREWLFRTLNDPEKSDLIHVVVTHHAPTYESVDPKYRQTEKQILANAYYCNNLDNKICYAEAKNIIWIHGHCHNTSKYEVGDKCKVYSNPLGYPQEFNPDYDPCAIISLSSMRYAND